MTTLPSVLVFDVNETLVDIDSLAPLFERIFGDRRVMREWFGQLVVYSATSALSDHYVDFFTLGQGVLRMLAQIHRVQVADDDVRAVRQAMLTMPAHPDVEEGLQTLRDGGFRLVTLTNSPPDPDSPGPLDRAGLAHFFEQQISVDECRALKPAPAVYRHACDRIGVAPAQCMMVAAHVWDTIGAQSAGWHGALIARPGNASLAVTALPQPEIVVDDLRELAVELTTMQSNDS